MKSKLPLKSLLKLSICFAAVISIFLFISTFIEGDSQTIACTKALFAFLLIMLLSIGNIGLFVLLKKNESSELKKYTLRFCILSFIMSTTVMLSMYVFHRYLISVGLLEQSSARLRLTGNIVYLYMSLQGILVNGIVLLLLNFVLVQDANNKAQLENSRLNIARSEAAYQLLLQQIHPHFLFNALNILKSLIKRSPERAEDYLMRLSDFLRVSVSGNKSGVAALDDEVKLSIDYLEMQRVRFGDALSFSFDIRDENNQACVLPVFSLQPLLENVIKHNELTEEAPLNIEVKQCGDWISVINNIQLKSTMEHSTGSGLANLAERYKLLSGDDIEIKDNGVVFTVSLKILNDEDCNHRR